MIHFQIEYGDVSCDVVGFLLHFNVAQIQILSERKQEGRRFLGVTLFARYTGFSRPLPHPFILSHNTFCILNIINIVGAMYRAFFCIQPTQIKMIERRSRHTIFHYYDCVHPYPDFQHNKKESKEVAYINENIVQGQSLLHCWRRIPPSPPI